MIELLSGTPGSGKSLHSAQWIYYWVKGGKPCICNFHVNLDCIKSKSKNFTYIANEKLTPDFLIDFANTYIAGNNGRIREESIMLVIDECQLLFNAREWNQKGRNEWLAFFTMHRHLGYRIVLVAQNDRMIDRQVRCLIEYEYIHRKLSNYGLKGKIMSAFAFGKLFVSVKVWYPMKEKVGASFFRAKKKYYRLYDSYMMFGAESSTGGEGDPERGSAPDGILDDSNT